MKLLKKLLRITVLIIIVITAVVLYANVAIYRAGQIGVYPVDRAPEADAAIVLGAKVYQSGTPSAILADRLKTGITLYKTGKVKKLLLTGDHGQVTYDEVNNMRLYALEHGVPEADIFMDHAGFSTYDSMYRARDVFKVKNAIIVTQNFHLPRALYIARSLGLNVSGVSSDLQEYYGQDYLYGREVLAGTKAFFQVAVGSKPKYLGTPIPITGDGRMTRDGVKI